jgi:hypothetical protein
MVVVFYSVHSLADEQIFKFKSPSFNGNNTSSHYLTIENQEHSRKLSLKAELKALQDEIERDKENTTLARFVRNLESRIYAQISQDLATAMFTDDSSSPTSGTLNFEGNIINWSKTSSTINLSVIDIIGTTTSIAIPLGDFTF